MYLNLIDTPKGKIAAVCDKELINTILKEGKIVLDIKNHSSFYKGKLTDKKEIESAIKIADSLNLVGKKCVEIAHSLGKIDKTKALMIQGIPHIQMYKL